MWPVRQFVLYITLSWLNVTSQRYDAASYVIIIIIIIIIIIYYAEAAEQRTHKSHTHSTQKESNKINTSPTYDND